MKLTQSNMESKLREEIELINLAIMASGIDEKAKYVPQLYKNRFEALLASYQSLSHPTNVSEEEIINRLLIMKEWLNPDPFSDVEACINSIDKLIEKFKSTSPIKEQSDAVNMNSILSLLKQYENKLKIGLISIDICSDESCCIENCHGDTIKTFSNLIELKNFLNLQTI